MGARCLLVGALEVGQSPDALQAIVKVVLQPIGGAMPHTHSTILRPWTASNHTSAQRGNQGGAGELGGGGGRGGMMVRQG